MAAYLLWKPLFRQNEDQSLLQPVQIYCTVDFKYLHTHTIQVSRIEFVV